ncbi:conserved exported hypothetical protein [Vibrio chagasii]|uniref:hypothetical protein n=1 Tax=Vibrio coralliirubri TaxID=1516159 RepID=UPI0006347A1E|nr:hypothetical protein [Vibrio coralliirubri]CAH7293638.1 conserved exported hypothetical protein [Vibrio chagasii]CDT48800.1 exported hypothetical protein [Vibrio coralliirubri]
MNVVTKVISTLGLAVSMVFVAPVSAKSDEGKNSFIFEAVTTPDVFNGLVKNPQDRGPAAKTLLKGAGCDVTGYYQGVHNLKTYIIADCDKDTDIAAIMFALYGSNAQSAGNSTATQVISTLEMKESAQNAQDILSNYNPPK